MLADGADTVKYEVAELPLPGKSHLSGRAAATLAGACGQGLWVDGGLCYASLLPLFRITDHRARPATEVSLPAQQPVVHADRRWCTWMYE
jgi:hypothetical protein